MRERIKDFKPYKPGLTLEDIREKYGVSSVIKLASNENPLGASPLVLKALGRHAAEVFRYPQNHTPRLTAALAERLGVAEDMVVVGNGSDEIIDMLFRVVAEPGQDNVLCYEHSFSMYRMCAALCGLGYRELPRAQGLRLPLKALAEAADKDTALVIVTSPDNPTGLAATANELAALSRALPEGALLVVDGAYAEFARPEEEYELAGRLGELGNVVLLRTFSKAYGLAGMRLGYGVMPSWAGFLHAPRAHSVHGQPPGRGSRTGRPGRRGVPGRDPARGARGPGLSGRAPDRPGLRGHPVPGQLPDVPSARARRGSVRRPAAAGHHRAALEELRPAGPHPREHGYGAGKSSFCAGPGGIAVSGHLIVTLDGPAGVGKSSMAQELAEALKIPYLDTGAMFRSVAWKLGQGSWEWDEARLAKALSSLEFRLHGSGAASSLSLNGVAVGQEIRTETVGLWGSNLAKLPVVRDFLKRAQQDVGKASPLVAEGRDMGSVVFPEARVKFFLDADVNVRAKRRFDQLREQGKSPDLAELTESIRVRDEQDRNRAVAPLKPAPDARIVDTSQLDKAQVAALLLEAVRERL